MLADRKCYLKKNISKQGFRRRQPAFARAYYRKQKILDCKAR